MGNSILGCITIIKLNKRKPSLFTRSQESITDILGVIVSWNMNICNFTIFAEHILQNMTTTTHLCIQNVLNSVTEPSHNQRKALTITETPNTLIPYFTTSTTEVTTLTTH